MKKAMKFLLWTIVGIVAFVLLLVLALPLWISPVATGVANAVVPGVTKTSFHLGTFKLNPYTGRLIVGDLQLGNPTNFKEKTAVDLSRLEVKVDVASLFGQKIRVELVDLGALQVYAAFPAADNFLQIARNAQGEQAAEAEVTPSTNAVEVASAEEKPAKGLQIDRLSIHDVTIKYGIVPIPFAMTLTGLGADNENGMSVRELYTTIKDSVMKAVSGAAGAIGDLGKSAAAAIGNLGKDATGAATGAAADAADAAAKAVGDGAKKAADALKGLFK